MMTFAALVVAAILVVSILYATFSRTRWSGAISSPPHSIFAAWLFFEIAIRDVTA